MSEHTRLMAGMLLASPQAYLDESRASWIQYVCAAHQYSMTRFKTIVSLPSSTKDFDAMLTQSQWDQILTMTDCSLDTCVVAQAGYMQAGERRPVGKPLTSAMGEPKYKWCVQCFKCDARPYLRWWWRMAHVSHCAEHGSRLSEKCDSCGGELILSHALMVNAGKKFAVPDLSYCQHCGMPLSVIQRDEAQDGETLGERGAHLEKAPSQPVQKRSEQIWGVYRFLMDEFTGSPFCGDRKKGLAPLNLTGRVFRLTEAENIIAMQTRPRWSLQIPRSPDRIRKRVAYALALVRREMQEDRRRLKAEAEDKK